MEPSPEDACSGQFHSFKPSQRTVSLFLRASGIPADESRMEHCIGLVTKHLVSSMLRWFVMRSYEVERCDLTAGGQDGPVDYLAYRSDILPETFSDAGSSLLDDLRRWLRSGNAASGEWGHLEAGEGEAIILVTKKPLSHRIAGFVPAEEICS